MGARLLFPSAQIVKSRAPQFYEVRYACPRAQGLYPGRHKLCNKYSENEKTAWCLSANQLIVKRVLQGLTIN